VTGNLIYRDAMSIDPLLVLALLSLDVVIAEWLGRRTLLRHFGPALLVILLAALQVNLGLLPTSSAADPVLGGIFDYLAPLAIFWLLLGVNLKDVLGAGLPLIALFLLGALGTALGVVTSWTLFDGRELLGEESHKLAGMFVGTYTGGSVNFNALAHEYGVARDGLLFAGATVVDNIMTTLWMAGTVFLPRALGRVWPRARGVRSAPSSKGPAGDTLAASDEERTSPADLALVLALGVAAVWGSEQGARWLLELTGLQVPTIIVLTTLALVLAQLGPIQRLRGARLLGMLAVMFFLAAIGSLCDLDSLRGIGSLGTKLALMVALAVGIHGLVIFGGAALLRLDPEAAAVASQANIGGGTTALALARGLGRMDLVLPAILIGSIGTAVGTYLGVLVTGLLR